MQKRFSFFLYILMIALSLTNTVSTGPQEAIYSLDFAAISFGGESAISENIPGKPQYSLEDSIDLIGSLSNSQISGQYRIANILDNDLHANNGLISVQGTKIKASWTETGKPQDAKGYILKRAEILLNGNDSNKTLALSDFIDLNSIPTPYNFFTDIGVQPNRIYYYIIDIILADNSRHQWLQPMFIQTKNTDREKTILTLRMHLLIQDPTTALTLHGADLNKDEMVDITDLFYAMELINNQNNIIEETGNKN